MTTKQQQQSSDEVCPECGSEKIEFNATYGFYKCNNCQHCWGHDKDDPDYDELEKDDPRYDVLYYGSDLN